MMEFAASLSDPGTLAAMLAAVAMFATITSVMLPALRGDKLETRLKQVTEQREKLRLANREAIAQRGLKKEARGTISDISKKLDLQKMLEDPNIAMKLNQAGLRGPRPLMIFYFCRFFLPFIGAVGAFIYIFFVNDHDLSMQMKYGSIVVGAAAGFYAPNMYVDNIAQKRQQSIMKAFPDALDMMLICVESGMSIEMAFAKVGAEVGTASVELAEELQLTTAELAYLQERRVAYENLAARTGHEGVKAVTMALIQAERYGTPLGDALRVMSKENREMRMAAAEQKAAALPAKLTVPMILFFLPVLFLVVLGPAWIKITEMNEENN
ncbi:MAG: type II secretion system F family protein [Henriciella sp.]|nr:type II secretion system F family protein [Henriciella sp.]